jgi:NAD(P)-dependent dehydrogenase (short-subunit alcohol dehydrogenase family)
VSELRYDGKVAIITGGGRGLGAAYGRLLASRGCALVINDSGVALGSVDDRADPAADLAAEITAGGGRAVADRHDVVVDGANAVQRAVDEFGRIDILINNAGIAGGGAFADIEHADFDRVFDVTARGARVMAKAAWPHLVASGSGRIVNTSSASMFGTAGTSAYVSAKSMLFGFTRALAEEGRPVGINVNSVMPSAFTRLTALIPDDAFRDFLAARFPPDLVAPFVAWLVHAGTAVTGECFSVGAGRAARVFLAEAPGVQLGDVGPEAWAEHAAQVMDVEGYGIPPSMMDEVLFQVQHLTGLPGGWP